MHRIHAIREVYTKSYGSKVKEPGHSMMEVTSEVELNLNNNKVGCQKDREGSYRSNQFEQKYEGMKVNQIDNKKANSTV